MINSPLFTVNRYDRDGDITEAGVFLHFENNTIIKVADTVGEFDKFIEALQTMSKEIKENY
jgi:hypothetical protein